MSIIRKFMNLVELGPVDANRTSDRDTQGRAMHADISYEVSATKVVATLNSYKSQTFTKLAQKIEQITELEQKCNILKEEIKQEGREQIADLFSADDSTRTRMIETVSFIMQITKDPVAAETVKYVKVIEDLTSKLTPELLTIMQALVEKYTTVQNAKPPSLSYSMKPKNESLELSEGLMDAIKENLMKFKSMIQSWGVKYDQKLADLRKIIESSVDASDSQDSFFKTQFSKPSDKFLESDNQPSEVFEPGTMVYSGSQTGKVVRAMENKPETTILELKDGSRTAVATSTLSLTKPSFFHRAFSKLVGESTIDEATLGQINSGMSRDSDAQSLAQDVKNGKQNIEINGKSYTGANKVKSTQLKVGDLFMNTYNTHNQGADVYTLMGYSASHDDVVEFKSLKDAAESVGGAPTLKQLGDKMNIHMIVKDLSDDSEGGFLYLCDGRWCRGSGAEPVTFTLLKQVNTEGYAENSGYDRIGKDFQTSKNTNFSSGKTHDQQLDNDNNMVSKWKTPQGKFVYVFKSDEPNKGRVINSKGKQVEIRDNPQNIPDIYKTLTQVYHCQQVNHVLSLADSQDMNLVLSIEPVAATEQTCQASSYPSASQLTDNQLTVYLQQWRMSCAQVDASSPDGQEFMKFGNDIMAQCMIRGISC